MEQQTKPAMKMMGLIRQYLAEVILVLTGLMLYGQSLNFEFVTWDDPWYIQNNELIKSWSWKNLYGICTENVSRNYAPLTIFSFLIDHTLYGDWSGGYHLTNILLHVLNAVLVLRLVEQLTKQRELSIFTAFCFLIHPLQVETVCWVSSRKGLLSATFMLLAMLAWCRPERKPKHELLAYGFLVLALLSKALAIIMPGLFLIYDHLYQQKKISESTGKILIPTLMCIMFLVWTAKAQTTIVGGVREHIGMSKLDILLIDSVLCWKYVLMLVYPQDLCILYDPQVKNIPLEIAISSLGWILVTILLVVYRKNFPQLLFAYLSIGMLMFPVLNFFPLTTLMNDRYLYLPIIPFFAALGGSLFYLARKLEKHIFKIMVPDRRLLEYPVLGMMMLVLIPWSIQNQERQLVWQSSHQLWEDTLKKVPQLAVVQIQWANTLQEEGDSPAAVNVLKEALKTCRIDKQDLQRIQQKITAWSNP